MLPIHHSNHLDCLGYIDSINLSSGCSLLKLILAWLSQLFSASSSCPLRCGMIHHIPRPKSTVNGVRWWNHQEWANSTQEFMRHVKRTCTDLCCCSCKTGYRICLLQAADIKVSHHLMAQYASRTPFYLGKNYSLQGVKQEVVCVADACLFGFHVRMATGTYLPCAVSTAVHTVHTMCHYCILHTFLQSKEQRV